MQKIVELEEKFDCQSKLFWMDPKKESSSFIVEKTKLTSDDRYSVKLMSGETREIALSEILTVPVEQPDFDKIAGSEWDVDFLLHHLGFTSFEYREVEILVCGEQSTYLNEDRIYKSPATVFEHKDELAFGDSCWIEIVHPQDENDFLSISSSLAEAKKDIDMYLKTCSEKKPLTIKGFIEEVGKELSDRAEKKVQTTLEDIQAIMKKVSPIVGKTLEFNMAQGFPNKIASYMGIFQIFGTRKYINSEDYSYVAPLYQLHSKFDENSSINEIMSFIHKVEADKERVVRERALNKKEKFDAALSKAGLTLQEFEEIMELYGDVYGE